MEILYRPTCEYDEHFEFPSYFHIYLKVNGLWPTDGDDNSLWFRIRDKLYTIWSWIVIGCTAFVVSAEWMYFFLNIRDVAKAVENMCTTIIGATIVVRCIHMRYAMKRLKILLRIFANEIWINQKSHPHIFNRCNRQTKPTFYLSISLWTVLMIYTSLPIVSLLTGDKTLESTDKQLPYSMVYPYDYQKHWNYIVTYIMAMFAGFVTVSQYYAMDALWALFISFLTGQFEILHGEILRLIPDCHAEWMRMYKTEVMYGGENVRHLQDMYTRRLHEIASRHNILISFSRELEKYASFPLMVNFVTSTLLICFVGFQFLIGGTNSLSDFSRFFLYFLSVTGQLYVVCNIGTVLITRSQDTAIHLYMCNWEGGRISKNSPLLLRPEDMELKQLSEKLPMWQYINYYPTGRDFQHKLRFMIMRSHRPVQLTAMHFMALSLETCSRIISSSMSYFALLKTFLDKQN